MKKYLIYEHSSKGIQVFEVEPKHIKKHLLVCHNLETNKSRSLSMNNIIGILDDKEELDPFILEYQELEKKQSKLEEENSQKIEKLEIQIEKLEIKSEKKEKQIERLEGQIEKKEMYNLPEKSTWEDFEEHEQKLEELNEKSVKLHTENDEIYEKIEKLENEVSRIEDEFEEVFYKFTSDKNEESKKIINSWGLDIIEDKPKEKEKGDEQNSEGNNVESFSEEFLYKETNSTNHKTPQISSNKGIKNIKLIVSFILFLTILVSCFLYKLIH